MPFESFSSQNIQDTRQKQYEDISTSLLDQIQKQIAVEIVAFFTIGILKIFELPTMSSCLISKDQMISN